MVTPKALAIFPMDIWRQILHFTTSEELRTLCCTSRLFLQHAHSLLTMGGVWLECADIPLSTRIRGGFGGYGCLFFSQHLWGFFEVADLGYLFVFFNSTRIY